MDQLIQESLRDFNVVSPITNIELIFSLITAAILNFLLAKAYIQTHGGYSYSKSFVHTMILVGIIISLIMVIIGSNIARAFALVGAMSIIRFRNPVKDSRDLVFIFAAIAIGMASGTGFYIFAIIFTFFFIIVLLALRWSGFGDLARKNYVLKLRIDEAGKAAIAQVCEANCNQFSLVSLDRLSQESGLEDVVYEVELRNSVSYDQFIQQLQQQANPQAVTLLVGESNVNV
jgi:hypothetical protein